MLFAVRMAVELPLDMDAEERAELLVREKTYSQQLQRAGKWPHIWRVVGQYANLSIFNVTDTAELHDLLWNLPMFAYMTIQITALTEHSSDVTLSPATEPPPV